MMHCALAQANHLPSLARPWRKLITYHLCDLYFLYYISGTVVWCSVFASVVLCIVFSVLLLRCCCWLLHCCCTVANTNLYYNGYYYCIICN